MADYGLQVYDESGNALIDPSTSTSILYRLRITGLVVSGTNIRSVNIPGLPAGKELLVVKGLIGGSPDQTINLGGSSVALLSVESVTGSTFNYRVLDTEFSTAASKTQHDFTFMARKS